MFTIRQLTNPILLHSQPQGGTGEAPAAPPASLSEEGGGGEETIFETLATQVDDEDDSEAEPAQPETPPAAAQPTEPQAPSPAQPTPQPPAQAPVPPVAAAPVVPTAQTPAPAPATATQPQAQVPAADPQPLTTQQVETAYQQYEKNILPQLETTYKSVITPELAKELDENPASAIPKLMARVHYNSHIAAYTGIISQLPTIIGNVLQRNKAIEDAESQFFGRWPDLKNPQYKEQVDQGLRAYRAANPKANMQEFVERAGLMLMISLGLNPTPTPPVVQQPVIPQGAPPPPAGRGGAGAPRPADRGAVNVWENMLQDDGDDS